MVLATGLKITTIVSAANRTGVINMPIEITQIKSFYPLGTTDGVTYTIVPRA